MPAKKANTSSASGLIGQLEPYFTKQAPFQIPENGRKLIVEWLPWINIVAAVLGGLALLSLLSIFGLASAVTYGMVAVYSGPWIWVAFAALAIQVVVQVIAFPGLRTRKLSAWKLLFWADIAYFVYGLFNSFSTTYFSIGGLIGSLLGLVIGLYILFQIKSYYK